MSYSPLTDFLGLLRRTSAGVRAESMPGLDFVVSALARAGMFHLSVSATAPTSNQANVVWFQPATQSWSAEGNVFLWDVSLGQYVPATPALWRVLLASQS